MSSVVKRKLQKERDPLILPFFVEVGLVYQFGFHGGGYRCEMTSVLIVCNECCRLNGDRTTHTREPMMPVVQPSEILCFQLIFIINTFSHIERVPELRRPYCFDYMVK